MAPLKKNQSSENAPKENAEGVVSGGKEAIYGTLVDMLSGLLDMPKDKFSPDTEIFEELPLDSLQLYELVVDLESHYGIRIPDEAIEKVSTIQDVVDMIEGAGK